MTNLFISTVRYEKMMENGVQKTVNEQYLLDAVSFTEAEARTIEELTPFISGEFTIPQIVKPRISELFLNEDGDRYYKVKVAFIMLDEKSGAEKKKTSNSLVRANDFKSAYLNFEAGMKGTIADYEILSISEIPILDYFPFEDGQQNDV
ncbi:MAG: DUF4494 domain-containing protein [Bacteroides sp.]|nr:DUF4494 domain-containing protein [Bacteroides sp.]